MDISLCNLQAETSLFQNCCCLFMITSSEIRAMIEDIRRLPDAIREAILHLNDDQLDTPYRNGGWTIRQVVHHLADSHINAYIRMKLILTENNPTLKPYDQDLWAVLPDARYLPPESSIFILQGIHFRWTVLLDNLTDDALNRTAYHLENGEVTLGSMIKSYSHHGLNHVKQITDLRNKMGWND